jgi:hypothetical protein
MFLTSLDEYLSYVDVLSIEASLEETLKNYSEFPISATV